MRLYKVLLSASILAASSMMLSSCLKDQEDVFDVDANNRLEQRLADCKNTLISSENGWVFDYFPDRNISYGGYVYGLKFTENDVTVTCELAPGETETSLYKMTNDNGPVLSFDSYNTLMHFFATPSGVSGPGGYEAYDGDFEFIIMDVKPDLITLRGNRTGNTMYLRRLDSDPVQYVSQAANVGENIFQTEFNGTCGSDVTFATNDLGTRYMEFQWQEEEKQDNGETMMVAKASGAYYVPTPTGIRFMEPVQVSANGGEVTELEFNTTTFTFTGTDSNGNAISMTGVVDPSYSFYNEFIGDFTFYYRDGARSASITIEADAAGTGYIIKGLSKQFDIIGSYNKSTGALAINVQPVGVVGGDTYMLAVWDLANGGSLTWSTDAGAMFVKDPDNPGDFLFKDNSSAYDPTFNTDSFIIWRTSSSGNGQATSPWFFITGNAQLPYISKITKK